MPFGPTPRKRPIGVTDDKARQHSSTMINGKLMSTQRPASQLREVLQLDNNLPIFRVISSNIRVIGRKYLRIENSPSGQKEAMKNIREELTRKYPEIFDDQDSERRLYLAERLASQQHLWARHLHKRDTDKNKKKISSLKRGETPFRKLKGPQEIIADTGPSTAAAITTQKKPSASKSDGSYNYRYRDFIVSTRFNSEPSGSATSGPSYANSPGTGLVHAAPRSAETSNLSMATPSNVGATSSTSQATPRTPSRRSSLSSSVTMHNSSRGASTIPATPRSRPPCLLESSPYKFAHEAIYKFLDACSPSMAHLCKPFVAYGCNDEEMLLAISRWTPDYINSFLHRFAEKSQQPISEMDIEMLQAHFLTYFKA